VADFLVEKRVSINRLEARKLIASVKRLIEGKFVTYDHFERVFAKPIFKGALMNIAWGLSKG
jgi:hypothetical protein